MFYRSVFIIQDLWSVVLGRWSVEEPDNNPLQNDLGLVLKVIINFAHEIVIYAFSEIRV